MAMASLAAKACPARSCVLVPGEDDRRGRWAGKAVGPSAGKLGPFPYSLFFSVFFLLFVLLC